MSMHVISTRTRRGVLAAGAVLASLSLAAPATAKALGTGDSAGDQQVNTTTYNSSGTKTADNVQSTDAGHQNGDITGLGVNYAKRKLTISVTMRQFAPVYDASSPSHGYRTTGRVSSYLQTKSPGRSYDLGLYDDGVTQTWTLERASRTPVALKCKGFGHSVSGNTVTFVVPAKCLSNPRKVRAGATSQMVESAYNSLSGGSEITYTDDALSNGINGGYPVNVGPWVKRG